MANQEDLVLLKEEDVEGWNEWREKNPEIKVDLSGANLSGASLVEANLIGANLVEAYLIDADLSGADLSKADLSKADLSGADLSGADLSEADLSGANLFGTDLSGANLFGADLSEASLSEASLNRTNLNRTNLSKANLIDADLSGAYLIGANLVEANLIDADLSGAYLIDADLSEANLSRANLSEASLSGADLSGADLSGAGLDIIQALNTNFQDAILTGACIEDWHINSQTNLDNVICDYIYLKINQQERRPHDPNKNFAPGEFTKLFQKALETVDLIFSDGIEWVAFFESFQQIREEVKSDELSIQAIEKKPGGAFVIRVEVPSDANKAEIEKYIKQEYETRLKVIETNYHKQLEAKDKEISIKDEKLIQAYKEKSTDLLEMARIMASSQKPPINLEVTTVGQGDTYKQKGNFGVGINQGEIKEGAKVAGVLNEAEQKNLAETTAEIQQLLKQLEQSYPTETLSQKAVVAEEAIQQIEANPNWKQRVISAVKAMGIEAFMELIDNPVANVLRAGIEGWLEGE